ncbi:MAG: hypothetical protein E7386_06870 [Ruminococcaceae bacterium]|jgi:hypothetical protein|nr:hypothetical protein [Oscillospiraceae bacterium]
MSENIGTNNPGESVDDMLARNMQQMYGSQNRGYDISDERLTEMEKKLPNWSLEPPFSYLK